MYTTITGDFTYQGKTYTNGVYVYTKSKADGCLYTDGKFFDVPIEKIQWLPGHKLEVTDIHPDVVPLGDIPF